MFAETEFPVTLISGADRTTGGTHSTAVIYCILMPLGNAAMTGLISSALEQQETFKPTRLTPILVALPL